MRGMDRESLQSILALGNILSTGANNYDVDGSSWQDVGGFETVGRAIGAGQLTDERNGFASRDGPPGRWHGARLRRLRRARPWSRRTARL